MNKMIIIPVVGLLLIPISVLAEVRGNVEFGCDIEKELEYTDVNVEYHWHPLVFDHIIYGGIKTYFYTQNWVPSQMINNVFTIGTILQYEAIYFKINHFCIHSCGTDLWTQTMWTRYRWSDGGTQISIGIKW